MPDVFVGQTVLWYPHADRNQPGHAALVTQINHGSLELSVLHPDKHMLLIKEGVKHLGDPHAKDPERVENGGWDHTSFTREYHALRAQVDRMLKGEPDKKGGK